MWFLSPLKQMSADLFLKQMRHRKEAQSKFVPSNSLAYIHFVHILLRHAVIFHTHLSHPTDIVNECLNDIGGKNITKWMDIDEYPFANFPCENASLPRCAHTTVCLSVCLSGGSNSRTAEAKIMKFDECNAHHRVATYTSFFISYCPVVESLKCCMTNTNNLPFFFLF